MIRSLLINLLLLHLLNLSHLLLQVVVFLLSSDQSLPEFIDEMSLGFQVLLLLDSVLVHLTFSLWVGSGAIISRLALIHHGRLVSSHLSNGSGVLLLADEFFDLQPEIRDHLDQFDVLSHDVHVVLLVNLLLFVKSLLKTCLGVFEISSLVFIFLLDIWVDFDVLHLLVLDIWIEVLVDGPFELVKVIDVLDNPVNGILEALDKAVICSNLSLVLLDELTHMLLSCSQIINNIAQIGINFIVMLKISIHIIGLFLELSDFQTSWSNVSLQLLDFVVEYELELFKLLGLLL
jgi:hypothetical protein